MDRDRLERFKVGESIGSQLLAGKQRVLETSVSRELNSR
jgi:hypothetical protein